MAAGSVSSPLHIREAANEGQDPCVRHDARHRCTRRRRLEGAQRRGRSHPLVCHTRRDYAAAEGGHYTLSWDGAWEWAFEIDTWEPNKRLRIVDRKSTPFHGDGQPMEHVAPAEVAIEFTLESKNGRTLLRIVHSGFGQGAAWDDEIDGVSHGWNNELRGLRHYLEHHRGQDRTDGLGHDNGRSAG